MIRTAKDNTDIFVRISIILFWIGLIALFLSIPSLINRWYTERSISILAWPSVLNADFVQDFECKTGIKVRITYFEHNEELVVKMRSGAIKGYDLVMPADYVVTLLIREGALKKIDHNRCTFWSNIDNRLQNNDFDIGNLYTIPYAFSIYGIAFDTKQIGSELAQNGWGLVFNNVNTNKSIGMIDDAREIASIAAQYLYNALPHDLTHDEWSGLKKMLQMQKQHVTMYTDMRADYLLLSGACSAVVTNSSEISRITTQSNQFTFFIPKEGSFWVIDSFVLPVTTTKEDLAYEFLNYLYRPEIIEKYVKKLGFSSALSKKFIENSMLPYTSSLTAPDRLKFFDDSIPESQLSDLWIDLKS